ncbi:alpha/beta hydrolase [Rossellomorea aquimaris]|uniref:Alpha/beta hydrolase n=1 Tax=Rossellomorea aquimaris TaxID=189382 RepID=A0A5D4TMD3_9BACI|nr:alpha/beta hydrolase [Rossellomorea aquimaris]TYS76940.1 alpha/beta hydrolase [Rossellomorea aquimaris]TYS83841.1 alpha/beta hydrolase [Rossellomorea aquimaris]
MKVKVPLNPQVSELLHTISEKMKELNHPPLDILTPEQSREFYKSAREFFTTISVGGLVVEDKFIPSSEGHDIPVRIYTPSGEGPYPVLIYSHGGGWVFGDLDSADNLCRHLSKHAGIVVVSVGYRLAPEHKYPSAFRDVIESIKWTFRHRERLKGDIKRIAVGGESSGGNLAAAAAIYFRGSEEYKLFLQVLITPVMDYNFDTLSYRENHTYNLTNEKMKWFWGHYLNDPSEGSEVYVSPLRVHSMKSLPNTLLVTAEFDPLREEGLAFSERLKKAGINVELLHYEDMVHSFINMIGTVDEAKRALDEMAIKLKCMLYTIEVNE